MKVTGNNAERQAGARSYNNNINHDHNNGLNSSKHSLNAYYMLRSFLKASRDPRREAVTSLHCRCGNPAGVK